MLAGRGCRISPRAGLRVPAVGLDAGPAPEAARRRWVRGGAVRVPGAGRARSRDPGRVLLPAPEDTGFENAQQAILIERYTTGNYCVRDSTVTYMPVISGELVLGTPL